ncbi:MAG: helix-turn-helix transcriptional regulator [Xanthomonadales bacterium]|nr:helix-turn-helix transcriptional regulator [Xanthomonadales bacterium]
MDAQQTIAAVGQEIRKRRTALGLSQDRFADSIGMHRAYFAAIERGEKNVTITTLVRVADGLACSAADLFVGVT